VCGMTIGSGSRLFFAILLFFSSYLCKVTRLGGENGQFQLDVLQLQLNLIVHQMCNWE
jgi:hypothetical protein